MNCIFNNCELWNGLLLGVLAAFVFAILTYLFQKYVYYKFTYGRIAGKFHGYGFKDDNETELGDTPISNAVISHSGQNLLSIRLETLNPNEEFIWEGEMRMSSLRNGRIVWRYLKPERLIHSFGIKECIVSDDKKLICLIGKDLDKEGKLKYGKEVLKRK